MKEESEAPAAGSPKHTPGPWTVFDPRCGELRFIRAGDRDIAETCGDNAYENAKLIAAAPMLAEEVKRLRAALHSIEEFAETRAGTEQERLKNTLPGEWVGSWDAVAYDARAALRAASRVASASECGAKGPNVKPDELAAMLFSECLNRYPDDCVVAMASALAAAETRGIEKAAEIAEEIGALGVAQRIRFCLILHHNRRRTKKASAASARSAPKSVSERGASLKGK